VHRRRGKSNLKKQKREQNHKKKSSRRPKGGKEEDANGEGFLTLKKKFKMLQRTNERKNVQEERVSKGATVVVVRLASPKVRRRGKERYSNKNRGGKEIRRGNKQVRRRRRKQHTRRCT